MSVVNKRKHVIRAVLQDALEVPAENQSIVRVVASCGNNLHEVEEPSGNRFLASMPTRFRRNFWIKRGDYILVEPIPEGRKVKGEIVLILTAEHQRFYRNNGCWPQEFETKTDKETDKSLNPNIYDMDINSDSSGSEDSDRDDSKNISESGSYSDSDSHTDTEVDEEDSDNETVEDSDD